MVNTFHLDIVTPTKELDLGEITYLRAPGFDGLFGVMARHTNSVFAIDIGGVKVIKAGEELFFAATRGYAEVTGNQVQLLVETIERSDEIDVARAVAAQKRAKERLLNKDVKIDRARAEVALSRAVNRLQISSRISR